MSNFGLYKKTIISLNGKKFDSVRNACDYFDINDSRIYKELALLRKSSLNERTFKMNIPTKFELRIIKDIKRDS